MRTPSLALAVLLLTAIAVPPAHAQEDAPYADEGGGFDSDALTPYGSWVDDGAYGHVWQPRVDEGWRPYVDGYWAWTDYGWTWVSYEPFGWTFHYGRWAFSPALGWIWVPARVWGPAWVDWFWGDSFVGWAPLPPSGTVVVNQFVFVNEAEFCHPRLSTVVLDARHLPVPVLRGGGGNHRPPDPVRITQVSVHPIRRFTGKPAQTVGPARAPAVAPRGVWVRPPDSTPRGQVGMPSRPAPPYVSPPALPGGASRRTERTDQPVVVPHVAPGFQTPPRGHSTVPRTSADPRPADRR